MRLDEELKVVSTNEVMEFVNVLKNTSEDVALQALAQYPEFSKMITDTFKHDKELIRKIIDASQQNADQCFMFYQEILNDISKCLEKEGLSYEERMMLIDKEIEVAQIVGQKEAELRELSRLILSI